ncbi:ABC transporter domain-containing protein [Pseudoscourfieldia marina]
MPPVPDVSVTSSSAMTSTSSPLVTVVEPSDAIDTFASALGAYVEMSGQVDVTVVLPVLVIDTSPPADTVASVATVASSVDPFVNVAAPVLDTSSVDPLINVAAWPLGCSLRQRRHPRNQRPASFPMDLLNGRTQHGVWGSTHQGLQIRVKGGLNTEKWAPRPGLCTAGWSEDEPEPFDNALEFKASLGQKFAQFPLVVWGNPAAGGEVGHSRAYAQSIKGLEEDELCSVLLEQENGETRPCPRLAKVVSDEYPSRVCVCCRPKLGLRLPPCYDEVDDDEMAMDDGDGGVADDGAAGAPQVGQSLENEQYIHPTRTGKRFRVYIQFYGNKVYFGNHDTIDDARRERYRALKFRAKVDLELRRRYGTPLPRYRTALAAQAAQAAQAAEEAAAQAAQAAEEAAEEAAEAAEEAAFVEAAEAQAAQAAQAQAQAQAAQAQAAQAAQAQAQAAQAAHAAPPPPPPPAIHGAPSSSSPDVAVVVHQPIQQPVQQPVWDWRAAARAAGGRQQPVWDWRAAARAAGGQFIGYLSLPPPNN